MQFNKILIKFIFVIHKLRISSVTYQQLSQLTYLLPHQIISKSHIGILIIFCLTVYVCMFVCIWIFQITSTTKSIAHVLDALTIK